MDPPLELVHEGEEAHFAAVSARLGLIDAKYGIHASAPPKEEDMVQIRKEFNEAVDQLLAEYNVNFVEKNGILAAGYRDTRFPLEAWHGKIFGTRNQQGGGYSALFMNGKDYVTRFNEDWDYVKLTLLKCAFWTPMTEADLDALRLFSD